MSQIVQDNAAIARRLWRAASEGDPEPVLDFDPKVIWRTHGSDSNSGEFYGIDAVLRYLANTSELLEEMRSELIDVLASEKGAVIRYRMQARRGLRRLDGEYSFWLRIEGGVVCEVDAVPFDQAAAAAFYRVD